MGMEMPIGSSGGGWREDEKEKKQLTKQRKELDV